MPHRVAALYLLDIGASAVNRSPIFSKSIRLVPIIARIPGGRELIRNRMIRGLRESSGRDDWIDAATQRSYAEPMLDDVDRVIRMAMRVGRAEEPDSLSTRPLPARGDSRRRRPPSPRASLNHR